MKYPGIFILKLNKELLKMTVTKGELINFTHVSENNFLNNIQGACTWKFTFQNASNFYSNQLQQCGIQLYKLSPGQIILLRNFINHSGMQQGVK